MMKDRTAQFLAQMSKAQPEPEPEKAPEPREPTDQPSATVHPIARARKAPAKAKLKRSRAELKHFGGYLEEDTLEKIALLRVRLKMDNSELIKHAIEELHRRHHAKRAFGDA